MQLCEDHYIVLNFAHILHLGTFILRDSEGNDASMEPCPNMESHYLNSTCTLSGAVYRAWPHTR